MSARERNAKGRVYGITACLVGLTVVGFVGVERQPARDGFDPSTDFASFCSAASPFTPDKENGEPTKFFDASVPYSNPFPSDTAPVHSATQGEVIQVRVKTSRPGAVAMHGVLEGHRLRMDDYVFARLKLKYTGRFPLHFHGDDGSHFEIAVFQVMSRPQ